MTISGLYDKSLENEFPSLLQSAVFFLICLSSFPTMCPSVGFLNGATASFLQVLGQDICCFLAAMENARRD